MAVVIRRRSRGGKKVTRSVHGKVFGTRIGGRRVITGGGGSAGSAPRPGAAPSAPKPTIIPSNQIRVTFFDSKTKRQRTFTGTPTKLREVLKQKGFNIFQRNAIIAKSARQSAVSDRGLVLKTKEVKQPTPRTAPKRQETETIRTKIIDTPEGKKRVTTTTTTTTEQRKKLAFFIGQPPRIGSRVKSFKELTTEEKKQLLKTPAQIKNEQRLADVAEIRKRRALEKDFLGIPKDIFKAVTKGFANTAKIAALQTRTDDIPKIKTTVFKIRSLNKLLQKVKKKGKGNITIKDQKDIQQKVTEVKTTIKNNRQVIDRKAAVKKLINDENTRAAGLASALVAVSAIPVVGVPLGLAAGGVFTVKQIVDTFKNPTRRNIGGSIFFVVSTALGTLGFLKKAKSGTPKITKTQAASLRNDILKNRKLITRARTKNPKLAETARQQNVKIRQFLNKAKVVDAKPKATLRKEQKLAAKDTAKELLRKKIRLQEQLKKEVRAIKQLKKTKIPDANLRKGLIRGNVKQIEKIQRTIKSLDKQLTKQGFGGKIRQSILRRQIGRSVKVAKPKGFKRVSQVRLKPRGRQVVKVARQVFKETKDTFSKAYKGTKIELRKQLGIPSIRLLSRNALSNIRTILKNAAKSKLAPDKVLNKINNILKKTGFKIRQTTIKTKLGTISKTRKLLQHISKEAKRTGIGFRLLRGDIKRALTKPQVEAALGLKRAISRSKTGVSNAVMAAAKTFNKVMPFTIRVFKLKVKTQAQIVATKLAKLARRKGRRLSKRESQIFAEKEFAKLLIEKKITIKQVPMRFRSKVLKLFRRERVGFLKRGKQQAKEPSRKLTRKQLLERAKEFDSKRKARDVALREGEKSGRMVDRLRAKRDLRIAQQRALALKKSIEGRGKTITPKKIPQAKPSKQLTQSENNQILKLKQKVKTADQKINKAKQKPTKTNVNQAHGAAKEVVSGGQILIQLGKGKQINAPRVDAFSFAASAAIVYKAISGVSRASFVRQGGRVIPISKQKDKTTTRTRTRTRTITDDKTDKSTKE